IFVFVIFVFVVLVFRVTLPVIVVLVGENDREFRCCVVQSRDVRLAREKKRRSRSSGGSDMKEHDGGSPCQDSTHISLFASRLDRFICSLAPASSTDTFHST